MRVQEIVGCIFFVLFLTGVACLIYSGGRRGQQPRRPRWIPIGFALEGAAFLVFGCATQYFSAHSAQPTVVGRIENLTRSGGKSASSHFDVVSEQAPPQTVHTRYTGPFIHNGEQASVRFLGYDGHVLRLNMLSGPTEGFLLQEDNDSSSEILIILFGVAFLMVAALNYGKLGEQHADI